MSIIPKLLALGLATALSSTGPPSQVDFSMPGPDNQRITQLWLVTYLNEVGLEVVAQAKLQSGDYAPLIAADFERLASMLPAARDLATTRNVKMRLHAGFLNEIANDPHVRPWIAPGKEALDLSFQVANKNNVLLAGELGC